MRSRSNSFNSSAKFGPPPPTPSRSRLISIDTFSEQGSVDGSVSERSESNSEHIEVVVRVRPLLAREADHEEIIQVIDPSTIRVAKVMGAVDLAFDHVIDSSSSQIEVYDVTKTSVDSFLQGYNSTVFAYGQTSTGKTYTMLGDLQFNEETVLAKLTGGQSAEDGPNTGIGLDPRAGLIPRSIRHVLSHIEKNSSTTEFRLSCSFLEIYNEKVFDLLQYAKSRATGSGLEIREDRNKEVFVQDLTEVVVKSAEDIYVLLHEGMRNRAVAQTDMNEYSSRSHTIFQIFLEQRPRGGLPDLSPSPSPSGSSASSPPPPDEAPLSSALSSSTAVRRSKLNLVDLAGSEKWKTYSQFMDAQRVSEMNSINLSLSTLGNCIAALSQPGRQHFPFRDSKLTRLLQDSLGGNTRTTFVATISPSSTSYEETLSTLKFADRAKRIQVHAKINEMFDDASLVKKYEREIAKLKDMLRVATEQQQSSPLLSQQQQQQKQQQAQQQQQQKQQQQQQSGDGDVLHLQSELGRIQVSLLHEREEKDRLLKMLQSRSETKGQKQVQDDGRISRTGFREEDDEDEEEDEDGVGQEKRKNKNKNKSNSSSDVVGSELETLRMQNELYRKRLKQLEEISDDQGEREKELAAYHKWLSSIHVNYEEEDGSFSMPVQERLVLLEKSVMMQSEELQRTKRLFVRDLSLVQQELQDKVNALQSSQHREAQLQARLSEMEAIMLEVLSDGQSLGLSLQQEEKLASYKHSSASSAPSVAATAAAASTPIIGNIINEPASKKDNSAEQLRTVVLEFSSLLQKFGNTLCQMLADRVKETEKGHGITWFSEELAQEIDMMVNGATEALSEQLAERFRPWLSGSASVSAPNEPSSSGLSAEEDMIKQLIHAACFTESSPSVPSSSSSLLANGWDSLAREKQAFLIAKGEAASAIQLVKKACERVLDISSKLSSAVVSSVTSASRSASLSSAPASLDSLVSSLLSSSSSSSSSSALSPADKDAALADAVQLQYMSTHLQASLQSLLSLASRFSSLSANDKDA